MGSGDSLTGLDAVTVAHGEGPPALRGVTLGAAPGEVLVVVGPSGSGKSTLLRAVAGLEPVRAGRVLVAGRDVTRLPTPQRDIAMVFQSTSLVPFLDVATNLARAVRARGESPPEADRRVAERGRRLRLSHLMPRMPRTLSSGENALAGIGRAMVRTPAAFLLDEPLAHLDAAERARARHTIVDLVRQAGVAALYVTHDQTEAMAVGDRLAVLRDGQVVQVDHPRRVYDRPVDLFVAGFLGDAPISLLPAAVVASEGGAGFRVGRRTLPLWGPLPGELDAAVPVVLGLRPEDVVEAGPGADPESVVLRGFVHRVERLGPHAVVVAGIEGTGAEGTVGGGTGAGGAGAGGTGAGGTGVGGTGAGGADGGGAGARLTARAASGTRLRPGDRVELLVDARRAHVFDARSGRALLHPSDRP